MSKTYDQICAGCKDKWMDYPAVKIPMGPPSLSDRGKPFNKVVYFLYCLPCARAILAKKWNIIAWLYRRKKNLPRITERDLKDV